MKNTGVQSSTQQVNSSLENQRATQAPAGKLQMVRKQGIIIQPEVASTSSSSMRSPAGRTRLVIAPSKPTLGTTAESVESHGRKTLKARSISRNHFSGDAKLSEKHNLTSTTDSLNTARHQIKQDYCLLALLKGFDADKDLSHASQQLHQFLENNGTKGPELQKRLTAILQQFKSQPELAKLLNQPATTLTSLLNAKNINHFRIDITDTIRTPERLDKRETGLGHTLRLNDKGDWKELYKSYDLSNQHDAKTIKKAHDEVFAAHPLTEIKEGSTTEFHVVLGDGKYGKCIPVVDIKTGLVEAGKKSSIIDVAKDDYKNASKLAKLVSDKNKHLYNVPKSLGISVSSKFEMKKGKTPEPAPQSLTTFALGRTSDEFYIAEKNIDLYAKKQYESFEDKFFEQVKRLVTLVQALEEDQLVQPDFKPENVVDFKHIDIGEIQSLKDTFKPTGLTPDYTMPGTRTKLKLNEMELKTYNRFSLGASLLNCVSAYFASDDNVPNALRLPVTNGFFSRGYYTEALDHVPEELGYTDEDKPVTDAMKLTLQFVKHLMADDRSIAAKIDLNQWVKDIGQARISQQT
ncbi:MAG TPA: hypothetical protein DHW71_02710 [Gammaproteobacteria bacterium]|nr:hypothetical protein [Gammaproteobacteria bacterium]